MFAEIKNPDSPYYQQGDCLVKKCGTKGVFKSLNFDKIPEDATPVKTNLILKGQNNNHALYDGKFQVFHKGEQVFVKVDEECVLDHVKDLMSMQRAEHHAQKIGPGEYFIDSVNEFDHLKEESRKIID